MSENDWDSDRTEDRNKRRRTDASTELVDPTSNTLILLERTVMDDHWYSAADLGRYAPDAIKEFEHQQAQRSAKEEANASIKADTLDDVEFTKYNWIPPWRAPDVNHEHYYDSALIRLGCFLTHPGKCSYLGFPFLDYE